MQPGRRNGAAFRGNDYREWQGGASETRPIARSKTLRGGLLLGSTFGTFGITSPQNAQVQAQVFPGDARDPANNNMLQQTVPVTQLSTLGASSDLQKYKDCLRTSAPQQCVEYVASDPLGDPREIKKQSGMFISIAPSDYELLANFTVEDDRVCQARVAQYLGIAYPHDGCATAG